MALFQRLQRYKGEMTSGGAKGDAGMQKLIASMAEPNARSIFTLTGGNFAAKKILQSEDASDQTKFLAGSLVTRSSSLPVASSVSDPDSGSYGHVNIIVPGAARVHSADAARVAIASGALPFSAAIV